MKRKERRPETINVYYNDGLSEFFVCSVKIKREGLLDTANHVCAWFEDVWVTSEGWGAPSSTGLSAMNYYWEIKAFDGEVYISIESEPDGDEDE